jgi:hypothetical protein
LEGHPTLEALWRRGKEKGREEWLGPLGTEDRHAIITIFLGRYRKRMEEEQIAALLGKAESGNPLYLLTALEELRTLGAYERRLPNTSKICPVGFRLCLFGPSSDWKTILNFRTMKVGPWAKNWGAVSPPFWG